MKKYTISENVGNWGMALGTILVIMPAIVKGIILPTLKYLSELDITWYTFWPNVGAAIFILGGAVRILGLFRESRKKIALPNRGTHQLRDWLDKH